MKYLEILYFIFKFAITNRFVETSSIVKRSECINIHKSVYLTLFLDG